MICDLFRSQHFSYVTYYRHLAVKQSRKTFRCSLIMRIQKRCRHEKKSEKKIISGGGKTDYIHTKCVLPKMFHTILCSPPDRSTADEHSKFCTDRKSFQKRKGVRFSKGRRRAFQSLGKKQFYCPFGETPFKGTTVSNKSKQLPTEQGPSHQACGKCA